MSHDPCCTQHRKKAPKPLSVPHTCPKCDKPMPGNEWFAYGRCEDCWVGDSPSSSYSGPRVFRDMFAPFDTGGGNRGPGQELKSGGHHFLIKKITTRKPKKELVSQ